MAETQLKKYELMIILVPDLTEKGREDALETIKKLLTVNDGKIESEAAWGLRDLAYTIQKHDKGFYVIMHVWHDPSNLIELEKEFKLDKNILRHLITTVADNAEIIIYEDKPDPREARRRDGNPMEKRHEKVEEKVAEKVIKEEKVEAKIEKEEEKAPEVAEIEEDAPTSEVKEETADETPAEEPKKEEPKKEEAKQSTKEELDEVEKKLNEIIEGSDINL